MGSLHYTETLEFWKCKPSFFTREIDRLNWNFQIIITEVNNF